MAKIAIWPDIYKEQGHWLPCVTLARTLLDVGHTVRFMGIEDCRSIVSPYNATFDPVLKEIYPPGYSFENKLEPLDQRWKPHHLLPITRGALDSVFVGANKPDLLVSGYFTCLETLLIYYKYNVKFVHMTTYLRHPQDDPAVHAKTKLIHLPDAVARKLMDSVLPANKKGISIEEFVVPLQNAKEMIPCPKSFDFTDPDWVHKTQVSYVEPMIVRTSLVTGTPVTLPDPITVPPEKRVLYATSGSMVQDYESQARVFFKTLISMMQTQNTESDVLVIAAGAKLYAQLRSEYGLVPGGTSTLPANVILRDWVSQIDIMGVASAAFMHGGLATIKEAIWQKIPIIIVPHGKDQMDNARRITRAGVGVVAEVGNLKPQDLRQLLTAATASTWIKQNLLNFWNLMNIEDTKPANQRLSVGVINGALAS